MLFYRIVTVSTLFLLGAALFSCQTDRNSDSETSKAQPETGEPGPGEPFHKVLTLDKARLTVKTTEGDKYDQLQITGAINGKKIPKPISRPIYPVVGADIADINRDGQPEVFIFTRIPGSGDYGRLFAYNFALTGYWAQINVQELPEDMQRGYQGLDTFEVRDGQLLRSFPLHLPDDPQGKPTGPRRTIVYALVAQQGNLVLQPVRTL